MTKEPENQMNFHVRNPETGEMESFTVTGSDGRPVSGASSREDVDRAIDLFLRRLAASAAARMENELRVEGRLDIPKKCPQ